MTNKPWLNKKLSEEHKNKIAESVKKAHQEGRLKISSNFTHRGFKHSEETKRIIGEKSKGRNQPKSEKSINWKGDNITYSTLHIWIRKHKPKSMFCECCGKITEKLDVANISGEYKRDISDYRWLCRKCHIKFDKMVTN